MEKEIRIIKKKGTVFGCLLQTVLLLAFWILPEVGGYFVYNWQMANAITMRNDMNGAIEKDLHEVSDRNQDLATLDIQLNEKGDDLATFVFLKQAVAGNNIESQTVTYELQAQKVATGVYKIYNPPREFVISFGPGEWLYKNLIRPRLPAYSHLLITPYSLELCPGGENCKPVIRTADLIETDKKLSYYF